MTTGPVIALDVMGGDGGPSVTLAGADIACRRYPDLAFRLYGLEDRIRNELATYPALAKVSTIVHAPEEILGTDKPSQALRRARHSSMGMAVEAVKEGEALAAVSAGNTGALMAIAKLALRTMAGIDRPALLAVLPTMKTDMVMLDLGANTECDAANLVQFAVMGAAFARTVLGAARPTVALLNIGEEDLKGTQELKEAAQQLRDAPELPLQFIGFTEGDKISRGDVHVVVTDGFTGNVALKTVEGTAKLVATLLTQAIKSRWLYMLGALLARGALRALRSHLDPNNHNGAVFLGLNGLVVKSHGGATAHGVANAIGVAHDLMVADINRRIADDLENFRSHHPALDKAQAAGAALS